MSTARQCQCCDRTAMWGTAQHLDAVDPRNYPRCDHDHACGITGWHTPFRGSDSAVFSADGVLLPPPALDTDDTAPLPWESAATPDELDELAARYADRAEEARAAHEADACEDHNLPEWMLRAYGRADGEPAGWGIGGPYGITWTGRA